MTNYLLIPKLRNSEPKHWQTYFQNLGDNFSIIDQQECDTPTCEGRVHTTDKKGSEFELSTVVPVGKFDVTSLIYRLFLILILTFSTTLTFGQNKKNENNKPFVLGIIDEIESKELVEKRILNIYLPDGYNQEDSLKYPVIYLFDGSADEDFIHIVGLVQFNSFEWINQVPKSIVVGIATVDRRRDFTFPTTIQEDIEKYPTTGHSDKFMVFIEKELQPFIEKKYKTNKTKTIIGQSLGGLFATEILLKRPTLFNKYIIISPSLWWDNGSLLNQNSNLLQDNFRQQTDIYIGVGKEGLTPTQIPRVMEVDANLLTEKIKGLKNKNIKVFFDYLPQENHATIMHQAVSNSFRLLYPIIPKE